MPLLNQWHFVATLIWMTIKEIIIIIIFEFCSFATFSAILQLCRDLPVVPGAGNQNTRRKPPPNPKSLGTFSHVLDNMELSQYQALGSQAKEAYTNQASFINYCNSSLITIQIYQRFFACFPKKKKNEKKKKKCFPKK